MEAATVVKMSFLLDEMRNAVALDCLDVGAHWTPEGVRLAFPSAVLSGVKAGG
ncbi:MAG TPA: hypothetical protein VNZ53_55025 [Steroidobacteraceae bacterium]|jgi:hypothetical protein|nr:hypothetical protein [Steroidobacteraceae bacterium]